MPHELSMRLSGAEREIRALVTVARSMPDVHGVCEPYLVAPPATADFSAVGSDPLLPELLELRLRVRDSLAFDYVHGRLGALASGAGVALEWLNED